MVLSVVLASVAGSVLLVLAYSLPVDHIRKNVRGSLPIFYVESDNYYWAPGHHSSKVDGFTDSLMLNEAGYTGTGSAVKDAMEGAYVLYPSSADAFSENLIKSVSEPASSNDVALACQYTRYWHGYLIFLKPLLLFLNYQQIRILTQTSQIPKMALSLAPHCLHHLSCP